MMKEFLYPSVRFIRGVADSKNFLVAAYRSMSTKGYDMPKTNADGPAEKAPRKSSKGAHSKKRGKDSKKKLSMDEILTFFFRSSGIVTVGIRKMILSDSWANGILGFSKVMQELYRIDNQHETKDVTKRSFAWMARVGKLETSLSSKDMELFQESYLKLPDKIQAWLSERSVILVASPEPEWNISQIGADHLSQQASQEKSNTYGANDFIDSFSAEPWKGLKAATAFPSVTEGNRLSYLSHYLHELDVAPIAVEQISRSSNRDSLILLAHRLSQSFESGQVDLDAVLKLSNAGFAAFSFETFIKLKMK